MYQQTNPIYQNSKAIRDMVLLLMWLPLRTPVTADPPSLLPPPPPPSPFR